MEPLAKSPYVLQNVRILESAVHLLCATAQQDSMEACANYRNAITLARTEGLASVTINVNAHPISTVTHAVTRREQGTPF